MPSSCSPFSSFLLEGRGESWKEKCTSLLVEPITETDVHHCFSDWCWLGICTLCDRRLIAISCGDICGILQRNHFLDTLKDCLLLLELSQLAEFPSSWGTSKMAKTLLLSQYLTQGEFMNSPYAHSLKRFLCMPLQLLFPASVEQDSQKEHCLGICPLREFWSPCITSTSGSIGFRASKLITLHIFCVPIMTCGVGYAQWVLPGSSIGRGNPDRVWNNPWVKEIGLKV